MPLQLYSCTIKYSSGQAAWLFQFVAMATSSLHLHCVGVQDCIQLEWKENRNKIKFQGNHDAMWNSAVVVAHLSHTPCPNPPIFMTFLRHCYIYSIIVITMFLYTMKSLRYKDTWNGVRKATEDPPACPQDTKGQMRNATLTFDEDCLYLNVYAPRVGVL